MKSILPITIFFLFAFHFGLTDSFAQPQTMSFQGRLTDGSDISVANGNRSMTFKLYDVASGGTALWEETQNTAISNGVFSVILGSTTPLTLDFDAPYWLGISVDGGAEMLPRSELTSTPYSFAALSVAANGVNSAAIENNSISNADINANAAIESSKISGMPGADFVTFDLLQGVTTTVTNLTQLEVTAPTDGYVLLTLSGNAILFGDGTSCSVGIGTSTSAFDIVEARAGILDGSDTKRYYESLSANIVVPVSAGTATYYINAAKSTVFDAATVNVSDIIASAVFIPNRY